MSTPTLNTWDVAPQAAGFDWIYWKTYLSLWFRVSDDVLHIHAGLLLLIVSAAVLRRPPWNWRPWLVAAVVEGANELYDVFQTAYVTSEGNWASARHDMLMTMLWPTVIVLTFPWFARRIRPAEPSQTP